MKYKVKRILEATPATKAQAENVLGIQIQNVLYGNEGYIVGKKWIPKEILEAQTVAYDNDSDIAIEAISEIKEIIAWVESGHIRKPALLLKEINKLQKLLKNEKESKS